MTVTAKKEYEESLNRLEYLPKQELDEELKKQWRLLKERMNNDNAE